MNSDDEQIDDIEEPEVRQEKDDEVPQQIEPQAAAEPEERAGDGEANARGDPPHNERYQLRDRGTLTFPQRYRDYLYNMFLAETQEPPSYKQAMQSADTKKWEKAMNKEVKSLAENNVWELVKKPAGASVIDCKWTSSLSDEMRMAT